MTDPISNARKLALALLAILVSKFHVPFSPMLPPPPPPATPSVTVSLICATSPPQHVSRHCSAAPHHVEYLNALSPQVLEEVPPDRFSFIGKVSTGSASEPASSDLFSAADFTQMARWCRLFPCMSLVRQAGVSSLIGRLVVARALGGCGFAGGVADGGEMHCF